MAEGSINHAAENSSAWVAYAMPSVADLIFIAVAAVLLFTPLSVKLLNDAGIGWHIRTGQWILTQHAIPHSDPFSSATAGKPWFAWEWLYDVFAGQLDSVFGLNGVVWLTAVALAATFAWTLRILIVRGVNVGLAVLLTLLAICASTIHFLARPHVISWLLTAAWFWILSSVERDSRRERRLYVLPLIMLIWVNVHGGFLVGLVLLTCFWIGAAWEWYRTEGNRIEDALDKIAARTRFRDLTWVGILCAIASLVNPYGWKLHAHIYSYLANRFLMSHVEEFQSPNFHTLAPRCFLALLLLVVAALTMRGRRLGASELLTLLFAIYAGLYASRNLPVASVLLVLIIGPLLCRADKSAMPAGAFNGSSFLQRMTQMERNQRGHLWCIAVVILTFLLCANGGRAGSAQWMDAHFGRQRMPVEAVNFIEQAGVRGPILSTDYWGGYLIYRLYPQAQVVVDDRHDLHGEAFLRSYLTMIHAEPGWQNFLHEHPAAYVLMPKKSALTSLLLEDTNWKSIYHDQLSVVFVPSMAPGSVHER